MSSDLYFKKLIPFRYRGESLQFRVSQLLFSSHRIDSGTRLLLRSLEELTVGSGGRLLDVGCGYGVIGLSLLKAGVADEAYLVDRDALAVEFARQNAALNELENVRVFGSLGYSDVPDGAERFDLIVSNIPGKAGDGAIASLLADAGDHLVPGGLVAVVIVDALEDYAADLLGALSGVEIVRDESRSGYRLFHYRFGDEPRESSGDAEDSLDAYLRDEIELEPDLGGYVAQVAYGLPDFDGPGIAAEMVMGALGRDDGVVTGEGGAVAVFNPGQGWIPLRVTELARPQHLYLIGADLLALQYSLRNLVGNGCAEDVVSLHHQMALELDEGVQVRLLVGMLRGNEDATEAASLAAEFSAMLAEGGQLVVAGKSTSVTRLAAALESAGGLRVVDRKKRRGFGLLVASRAG